MTAKRVIYAGISAMAIFVALLFILSPIPWVMVWLATEALFPSTISWDGKTAYSRCGSAIAGRTSWPPSPQGACQAMHMCANEAQLSDQQTRLLYETIRNTPGCQEP